MSESNPDLGYTSQFQYPVDRLPGHVLPMADIVDFHHTDMLMVEEYGELMVEAVDENDFDTLAELTDELEEMSSTLGQIRNLPCIIVVD